MNGNWAIIRLWNESYHLGVGLGFIIIRYCGGRDYQNGTSTTGETVAFIGTGLLQQYGSLTWRRVQFIPGAWEMQSFLVGVTFEAVGCGRFLGTLSSHLHGSGSAGEHCGVTCHGR